MHKAMPRGRHRPGDDGLQVQLLAAVIDSRALHPDNKTKKTKSCVLALEHEMEQCADSSQPTKMRPPHR